MKHRLYATMGLALLLACPAALPAQRTLTAERGEAVELTAAAGYATYQWQVSTDGLAFADYPGATARQWTLRPYATAYYRAVATDADGATRYLDTVRVAMTTVQYAENYTTLSAAHGYVETLSGQPGASGISIPEEERVNGLPAVARQLTNWTSGDAMAVYYVHHPADTVDVNLRLTVRSGRTVNLRVTVWDPTDLSAPLAEQYLAVSGTGSAQTLPMVGFVAPRADYFRYQLECLEGWADVTNIDRFFVYSHSSEQSWKAAYLSSPSVHLTQWRSTAAGAPTGASYDWCYQEVMMPPESDIVGTYVMSLGVLDGYMGIQNNGTSNGETLHEVLFSMWDDGDTDQDPNLPANRRASVVDHDPQATVNRFGNEGTGMQTYYRGHHWEAGQWVQFLTNCRPETMRYQEEVNGQLVGRVQHNMLVSTWFNAGDGKGWQYMSTLRLPNNTSYFDSWYSFLENYNAATGEARRKGYYRNGYARSRTNGRWFHFNEVSFGHTDGGTAPGARNDWGQGVADDVPGAFFMATGGYLPTDMRGSSVTLRTDNTPVDTIDLETLEARVDLAVANEQEQMAQDELFNDSCYDKSGWEVVSFSSQETAGEGSNGRAALVIDGDDDTYWHSAWYSSSSSYPHWIVVDMKEELLVGGFEITMSGGSNRYIKSYEMQASNDGRTWTTFYADADTPNDVSFRVLLDEPVRTRYFRLYITDGRATDGDHVRVNEIDVVPPLTVTGVGYVPVGRADLTVSYDGSHLDVTAPRAAASASVRLVSMEGRTVARGSFDRVAAGDSLRLAVGALPAGTYAVLFDDGAPTAASAKFVMKR